MFHCSDLCHVNNISLDLYTWNDHYFACLKRVLISGKMTANFNRGNKKHFKASYYNILIQNFLA